MSDTDEIFTGSIPDIYNDFLVPLIFEDFARDLAERVERTKPARVLDTAAGSRVVTRALLPLLAQDAVYTVTDLNQPMLDRAVRGSSGSRPMRSPCPSPTTVSTPSAVSSA